MTLERPIQELASIEDGARAAPPPPPEELGFPEIRSLLRTHWKLILGLGLLFGALTVGFVVFLIPETYLATAKLSLLPPAAGGPSRSVAFYRSLLESEGILERASRRLVGEGELPEDRFLVLGEQVFVAAVEENGGLDVPKGSALISVTGRSENPEVAAAIANTVAEIFIEEARSMLRSTAGDSEKVLAGELSPTREALEAAEASRTDLLSTFQAREEEISTSWDRRIAATEKTAETALAEFRTETRRLLGEAVNYHLRTSGASEVAPVRSKLLEIAAVRAQLAQTPRVLVLEKAASDETLAELLVAAKEVGLFEGTLVSEQLNPLHDELSLRALALEGELKSVSGADASALAPVLAELERIQQERLAGLTALEKGSSLELRIQRRRRSRALEELYLERSKVIAEIDRQISQLAGLERQLSDGLNKALISRLLEEVEVVHLAAPAVPQQIAEPRSLPLKAAAAVFLGAMLGLMIALFRSAPNGAPAD